MARTHTLTEDQKQTLQLIIGMSKQIHDQCGQVINGFITDPHLIISTVDSLALQIRDLTKAV